MPFSGQDVIDIGSTRVGEDYVFGANVPLNNPNWHGPWDCAEFTSWCAFQAYGLIFGAGNTTNPARAEPFSGHWFDDAKRRGHVVTWQQALTIPGAALVRAPAPGRIGHVAFALGDGQRTLEARGKAFGVGIFGNAQTRPWSLGCLLPGVDYDGRPVVAATGATATTTTVSTRTPLPAGFLWQKRPPFKGGAVVALQKALAAKRIDPGPIDGTFGPLTGAAVTSFQVREGLEVDGIVGPNTARALGLAFPIPSTPADEAVQQQADRPPPPPKASLVVQPPPAGFDGITGIAPQGRLFAAKTGSGFTFLIGSATNFTDDMHRVGLFQGSTAIADSLKFGTYSAAAFRPAFGPWADFIEPTLTAEGGARFATINTYDRAAFTFGAPQLAAHTPDENFIVYLRRLLALPDAALHFPELSLRSNAAGKTTVHLQVTSGFEDLEAAELVTRPNGRKETQLRRLMTYLNPSPVAVDAAELTAAARLMNWLRLDPRAKELQISVFIDAAKKKLATAKTKVPAFTGADWRLALWIMDILHQGRGTFPEIAAALAAGNPQAALKKIGDPKYRTRITTVAAAVSRLEASGTLNGFTV